MSKAARSTKEAGVERIGDGEGDKVLIRGESSREKGGAGGGQRLAGGQAGGKRVRRKRSLNV